MEMSFIASFWLVSFLLIITPGADWAYTISAGINGRRVIPAVAGLMSGHLLATLIVVAGIGVLIAGHPLALSTITLLGAGYLMWLGIAVLRHPPTPGSQQYSADSWNRWAIKGLCISGLNPKVFLLFLALLPQFTDPQGLVSGPADVGAGRYSSGDLHAGLFTGRLRRQSAVGDPASNRTKGQYGFRRDDGRRSHPAVRGAVEVGGSIRRERPVCSRHCVIKKTPRFTAIFSSAITSL